MPELAAHLERVARELARINGVHLCQTCGHRRGEHAMDLVGEHFCEHDEGVGTDCCNCQNYLGVGRPNYAELVAALESAAAALAACAREARNEALWDAAETARRTPFRCHAKDDVDFHSGCVQTQERIVDAIRKLRAERAVGEKA